MGTIKARRIAAVGVIGGVLVATSLAAAGQAAGVKPATSSKAASCLQQDDRWPAWVQGRPAGIDPRTTAATYMWHDGGGWHIRVTHRTNNRRTFSGQLITSGGFTGVRPVHLEKSDTFQVSRDKHDITFLFKNYGAIDGLDFFTHCAPSIQFSFQSDGKTSPSSKVVIGRGASHPASDPFTISRSSTSTSTTTSMGTTTTMGPTTTIETTTTMMATTTTESTTTTMGSTTTSGVTTTTGM